MLRPRASGLCRWASSPDGFQEAECSLPGSSAVFQSEGCVQREKGGLCLLPVSSGPSISR